MPYTSHGHWFGPGQSAEPRPQLVAKCGGPGMCAVCAQDASLPPDIEIERLKATLREARLSHIDTLLGRIDATRSDGALMRRLYAAWWSARIGRAKARQEAADLRTTLSLVGGGLNFVGDHAERVKAQRDQLMTLVRDLIDPDDCWFDPHGGCQAHGYLSLQPGEKCPHAEAKELLAAIDKTKAPGT